MLVVLLPLVQQQQHRVLHARQANIQGLLPKAHAAPANLGNTEVAPTVHQNLDTALDALSGSTKRPQHRPHALIVAQERSVHLKVQQKPHRALSARMGTSKTESGRKRATCAREASTHTATTTRTKLLTAEIVPLVSSDQSMTQT
jgi:hypothetical protein